MDNILDTSIMYLLSLTPFYREGWGDPRVLAETRRRFVTEHPTVEVQVKWVREPRFSNKDDVWEDEGYFETPVQMPMPAVTRTAWFLRRIPKHNLDDPIPIVVLLAATGDETYVYRTKFSNYLLEQGIGVIILVNPFYWKRRPEGQFRSSIRSFSDQLLMNYMTVEESRSLLKWILKDHPAAGVSGYSMGGFMTSYTAAMFEDPIAAVPAAAGLNAGITFTDSVMKRVPSWKSLKLKDVEIDPQILFTRSLAPMNLDELPRPKDPESAIVIGNTDDAVVPPAQVQALFDYWQCRELRWLHSGHSTGYIFKMPEMAIAIGDAVAIRMFKAQNGE